MPVDVPDFDELESNLRVVGTSARMRMLHQLRSPKRVTDLRVPAKARGGEPGARLMARQSVAEHLQQMVELGVVKRTEEDARDYVVNAPRFYQIVEEFRRVGSVLARGQLDLDVTVVAPGALPEARMPEGLRLVIVHGLLEGKSFPLEGPEGTEWTIGRGDSAVSLDYDPYVSMHNSTITAIEEGLIVHDADSRNGTWVDWRRLDPGKAQVVKPGSVIGVGRSLMVVQK